MTLYILFSYLSFQTRRIQKKTDVPYVSPNPLAMIKLPARIEYKVESFLCIPGMNRNEEPDKEVTKDEITMDRDLKNTPETKEDDIYL